MFALEQIPKSFDTQLEARAKQVRFRGVGNPYAFLDEIGLVPIKEFIYRGRTIIDVAESINVPVTVVRQWIEKNQYSGELEDASKVSAEGYLQEGQALLRTAQDPFQLNKAKAMLKHAEFMASKKDKETYGAAKEESSGNTTYVINIGDTGAAQKIVAPVIEAEENNGVFEMAILAGDDELYPNPPVKGASGVKVLPVEDIDTVKTNRAMDSW